MRRQLVLTAVVGGLLLTGCGSQKAAETVAPDSMTPVAAVKAASMATTKAGTARITLSMVTTADGETATIRMAGPMALDSSRADLTMSLPGAAMGLKSGDVSVRYLVDKDAVFLKFDAPSMPATWFTISKGAALDKAGLGSLNAAGGVKDTLATLGQLGEVTRVGTETVNGVSTTHYHADVDPAKIANLAGSMTKGVDVAKALGTTPVPVDLWIDDAQHIVRTTESFTLTMGGKTISEKVTSDLSEFGVPVSVTAPKDAVDLSAMLGK
jgi:hypothetical protein